LLKSTNQLAEGHLDIPIEGDVGLFNPIQEELKRIQKGFKKYSRKDSYKRIYRETGNIQL